MRWSRAIAATASATVLAASTLIGSGISSASDQAARTEVGGRAVACTITGTPGNDTLQGTGTKDVICGLGGNDTIEGLTGSDVIDGGADDDVIDGGKGNDVINGNFGDDSIMGRSGDDSMNGGDGSDTCRQNLGTGSAISCEWPNPILICPVKRGTVYNDFGDIHFGVPHPGNDIIAKKGEPVKATFPGRATHHRWSGAGLTVQLTRSDGAFTYNMHLSRFAPPGHYKTGDVIGYVGSTGNAGTTNHLHFEWHPDGGDPVDPFPYLSKVCPDVVKAPQRTPAD